MDERRTARVAEAIREELLEIIGFEMADPRLREIQVGAVEVSQKGDQAHVRVVCPPDPKQRKQALNALDNASGFLRHELASRLDLRHVPELKFEVEKYPNAEERINILLKRAGKSRGTV